jgi:hypothetical protein
VTEKVKSSHIYKYLKPVNPWKINCKACVANWTLSLHYRWSWYCYLYCPYPQIQPISTYHLTLWW